MRFPKLHRSRRSLSSRPRPGSTVTARVRDLRGDPYVRAFRFARQRIHHHWAAAIFFDQNQRAYVWYPESSFPVPVDERFVNAEGASRYAELFAERPVRDVLARLEERVTGLGPRATAPSQRH
jgi:hypothetical protein